MEIGSYNKKTIENGEVKKVFFRQPNDINTINNNLTKNTPQYINTVSKSKDVTLDLDQFLEDSDRVINNQAINTNNQIETLFEDNE